MQKNTQSAMQSDLDFTIIYSGSETVQGLDKLHELVKKKGWEQISDITEQQWGARECSITTIDGYILRFFETI